MKHEDLLRKYARLAVRTGVNVQKGQHFQISAKAMHYEFVRMLVEEGYEAGAKVVTVNWSDDLVNKSHYMHQDIETLTEIPQYKIDEVNYKLSKDFCTLSVYAPSPGLLADVDGDKIAAASKAQGEAFKAMREHMMANRSQWSLISLPTKEWATVVFPELDADAAVEKLLEAILYSVRVREDNDPIVEWDQHNATLSHQNKALNDYNFKSIRFKNGKGTDIEIGLVKDHVWAGGKEASERGYIFNPNMPTEESFSMPDNQNVNGMIYSTKPLNYNGKLIDEFWLKFVDGKVVDYDAKVEKETLKALLETDEGSLRLGEVALISHVSPISDLGILFYNTLFDENASCHVALGASYPMNIKNGTEMSQEELISKNANQSLNHEDFMFGSADMHAVGITHDGQEVDVIVDGNIVI